MCDHRIFSRLQIITAAIALISWRLVDCVVGCHQSAVPTMLITATHVHGGRSTWATHLVSVGNRSIYLAFYVCV